MDEEKTLTAEKTKKPTLWDGALKMVKGENTNQLIEQFTAEMTLVAEGLCEDQTRLRKEVDGIAAQEDKRIQKLERKMRRRAGGKKEERGMHETFHGLDGRDGLDGQDGSDGLDGLDGSDGLMTNTQF